MRSKPSELALPVLSETTPTRKGRELPEIRITVMYVTESTKPILCSKWGKFGRAKPILEILLASWTFGKVEKGFRSFNSKNLVSVGQRAAKLLAIKLWEWFDPGRSRIRADGTCRLLGHKGRRVYKRKVWRPVTLQPFDLQTPNL